MATSFLAILPFANHASAESVGSWGSSPNFYPLKIDPQSCAIYSGYIYCVGGYATYPSGHGVFVVDAVYYATVSPSGVGGWTSTTSYPTGVATQSCAIYSGYIYCVGGVVDSVDTISDSSWTSAVYYAEISPQTIMTVTLSSTVTSAVTQLQTTTVATSSPTSTELLAVVGIAAILVLAGAVFVTRRRSSAIP